MTTTIEPTEDPAAPLPPGDADAAAPPAPHASGSERRIIFWILAALLMVVPTVSLPEKGPWLGVKAFVLEAVGILLAVLIVSRGNWTRERVRQALLAAPNLAILGFLVWVGVSAAHSPYPQLSRYEAMRHLGGGLVYFAVVYGLSVRRHLERFVLLIALAGSVAALLAFVNSVETDRGQVAGAFQNQQLLAGFLCLLFPLLLTAAQAAGVLWRRILSQAAAMVVGAGILVTQNRSAWVGTLLSLVVLAGITLVCRYREGRGLLQKHLVLIPVIVVVLSFTLFFALYRVGGALSSRAATVSALEQDPSFRWRLGMWNKAVRITLKHPVLGCGVGTFPLEQALYDHPAVDTRDQIEIVGSSRVDLQACKLEYSIVSPK